MQTRLFAQLNRQLQRESGLSGADYEVLACLSETLSGRLRAFELGRITQWEKSRLSHHLTRMEQRGLVARETCASDSRYAEIVLTAAGRDAIESAAARHVAHVRSWFVDAMTPEQLDQFGHLCDSVSARLDDAEPDACGGPAEPAQDRPLDGPQGT